MVVEKSRHSRKGTMKTTDEMRRASERFQLKLRALESSNGAQNVSFCERRKDKEVVFCSTEGSARSQG
jgi:hypothetical protein